MKILITGIAGFIGFHLAKKLVEQNNDTKIIGIDNFNNYYDYKLKYDRIKFLKKLKNAKKLKIYKIDISNKKKLLNKLRNIKIDIIINLAAQAGVRYSITNPDVYLKSNILGFFNILELSRLKKISHLISASTSSVYGDAPTPFREDYDCNKPLQFYAATKKSNEVMAYSYNKIYSIPVTMLRFFTVYGPWGRPDMAIFKFVQNILKNKEIKVFNHGNHYRDFTFIDDVINSLLKIIKKKKTKKSYLVLNIGNNKPVHLKKLISILEKLLNKKARKKFLKIQKGDVFKTYASISKLNNYIKFKSSKKINDGLKSFVDWYKSYYL